MMTYVQKPPHRKFCAMQGPIICWILGLKHVHAMAESVSASEQPEYADGYFKHDTCEFVVETSLPRCVGIGWWLTAHGLATA